MGKVGVVQVGGSGMGVEWKNEKGGGGVGTLNQKIRWKMEGVSQGEVQ